MWTDERGSEVLDPAECRRLLAIGAKEHRHGHVAVNGGAAPVVLPVDYSIHDSDVILRVGQGLFSGLVDRLVTFQVDGTVASRGLQGIEDLCEWSVMAQGLATEVDRGTVGGHIPRPRVADPGNRWIRIRTDVLSGRRLTRPGPEPGPADRTAADPGRRGADPGT